MRKPDDQFIKHFPKGLEAQISDNFWLSEYECSCSDCLETLVSMAHVARLEKLRSILGKPLRLNSAYRCAAHNAAVGGVPGSQHVLGAATDVAITDEDLHLLRGIFPGVILYDTFTHLDSRNTGLLTLDKRTKK